MRTDSVNLSDLALNTSKTEIVCNLEKSIPKHEDIEVNQRYKRLTTIRPTFMNTHTISKEAALEIYISLFGNAQ